MPQSALRLCLLALTLTISFSQSVFVVKTPKQPFTAYPTTEKINLHVGLDLEPSNPLRWVYARMENDTWVVCLGPAVEKNAIQLARQLFTKVTVITNRNPASLAKFDAILGACCPTFVTGWGGFDGNINASASVFIQWSLLDPFQRVVWSTEVASTAFSPVASANPEKLVQTALFDAFRKSHEILRTSPAIKTLAKKPAR